ncbi:16S rRNA (guanine(966)-N(2))-methyltransferase RsmD [Candidatus Vallotiella sp. (ex Adelges kitamiensis)]
MHGCVPFTASPTPHKHVLDSPGSRRIAITRHVPQKVRIIGGIWKRTPLPVLDLAVLRPTPNHVRETLFNWLGQQLRGFVCLDLFAGTGALGFEAASRGAQRVVMVEHHTQIITQISSIRKKLNAQTIEIVHADALQFLARLPSAEFDIVFLDPPFDSNLLRHALPFIFPLITPRGSIYVESNAPLEEVWNTQTQPKLSWSPPQGWHIVHYAHTGAVHYHLLRRKNSE